MRYVKKLGLFVSAIVLFFSAMAISADAQHRYGFHRPIIVRSHAYLGSPFWGWGWGYNPYWNDPYYWEQRQRYYDQQSVNDAGKKLRKDQRKYNADGYLTPKEQEKLAKDQEKYDKALNKLQRDG
jgi:hypothetical protein